MLAAIPYMASDPTTDPMVATMIISTTAPKPSFCATNPAYG